MYLYDKRCNRVNTDSFHSTGGRKVGTRGFRESHGPCPSRKVTPGTVTLRCSGQADDCPEQYPVDSLVRPPPYPSPGR